ncbi:MAG: DUF1269 domain-containing protein [Candidatus Sulfotelmatobacter sp.]
MNRILVVVFSEAGKAFEGRDALKSLGHDDSIALHAYAIITKKADGTIVNEEDHHAGFSLLPGTSLRSLIESLSKPIVPLGAATEALDPGADQDETRVVSDFVNEVSRQLNPGKFALVAEIDEEWTPWVNLRMTELGGVVYRCPLSDVNDVAESEDIVAMKADLAQKRAEHARASAVHKAKLLEKINQLDTKIQQRLQKAKERRVSAEVKDQAKVNTLEAKAARARGQMQANDRKKVG